MPQIPALSECQWVISQILPISSDTHNTPRLREVHIVMRSFLFMFSRRSATHGNTARAKSKKTAYARARSQFNWHRAEPFFSSDDLQHTMNAIVARFRRHFLLLASRGFHSDSTGVHCANTVIQVRMLRMDIVTMQIQRNHLCLQHVLENRQLSSLGILTISPRRSGARKRRRQPCPSQ